MKWTLLFNNDNLSTDTFKVLYNIELYKELLYKRYITRTVI